MFGNKQEEAVQSAYHPGAPAVIVRQTGTGTRAVEKLLNEHIEAGWRLVAVYPIVAGIGGNITNVQAIFKSGHQQ